MLIESILQNNVGFSILGLDFDKYGLGIVQSILGALVLSFVIYFGKKFFDILPYVAKLKNFMFKINVARRFYNAGASNFFASRDDYTKYRKKSRQFDYLMEAKKTIDILSQASSG
jgi:hypothetical protein